MNHESRTRHQKETLTDRHGEQIREQLIDLRDIAHQARHEVARTLPIEEGGLLLHQVRDELQAKCFHVFSRRPPEAVKESRDGEGFHDEQGGHGQGEGADDVDAVAEDAFIDDDPDDLWIAESGPDAEQYEECAEQVEPPLLTHYGCESSVEGSQSRSGSAI